MTLNDVKINDGSLQSDCHDVIDAVLLLADKLRVNAFLLQL